MNLVTGSCTCSSHSIYYSTWKDLSEKKKKMGWVIFLLKSSALRKTKAPLLSGPISVFLLCCLVYVDQWQGGAYTGEGGSVVSFDTSLPIFLSFLFFQLLEWRGNRMYFFPILIL